MSSSAAQHVQMYLYICGHTLVNNEWGGGRRYDNAMATESDMFFWGPNQRLFSNRSFACLQVEANLRTFWVLLLLQPGSAGVEIERVGIYGIQVY